MTTSRSVGCNAAGWALLVVAACSAEGADGTRYDTGSNVLAPMPGPGIATGGTSAPAAPAAGAGGTGGIATTPLPAAGTTGGLAGTGGLSGAAGDAMMAGTGGTGAPPGGSCLDGIEDYANAGPFDFQPQTAGSIKMWVPMVPAGCKVPVIHLANGTGGTCSAYQAVHERFASHGFLATCYESGQTGAGTQGLMAFQTAHEMYPDLADLRFGSTGHSQGGQAAFTVLQLAEAEWGTEGIYAGLAMEPASGFGAQPSGGSWQQVYAKITSPMFMFSGTSDILVSASWVAQAFAALSDTVEAYNWSAIGATHIPVPNSETMEVGVPWFRWKLLGDQKACAAFKALAGGGNWESVSEQNAQPCQ